MERRVGISYTGVDGRKTSFSASSPSSAMERLGRVKGFGLGEGDRMAATMASAMRSRRGARKERIEAFRSQTVPDAVASVGAQERSEERDTKKELIDVITGISFDSSKGPLVIRITRERIRVSERTDYRMEEKVIGEPVMVHENHKTTEHSMCYVLHRQPIQT